MRSASFAVTVVLVGALWAGGAYADDIDRPVLSILSQEVGSPSYNAEGRLVRMEMKRFDSSGKYIGERLHFYEYSAKGQVVASEVTSFDADELQLARTATKWDLEVPGILRVGERTYFDGYDQVLRRERETWRQDAKLPILTIQTEYFDAHEVLVKTRYSVTERDRRGYIVVQDSSVFDAQNVQLSRTFSEWTYVDGKLRLVAEQRFDESDELLTRAEIRRQYDVRGRWTGTESTFKGAQGQVTGYSHGERELNPAGRVTHRTVTWTDADGIAERRMSESTTYDESGRMKARRVSWEYLQ
jgi:hypothetical protein